MIRNARTIRPTIVLAAVVMLWQPSKASSQSVLGGAAGGVAGVAAGGYLSLSIAVAEARAGRYLTGMDEFLGWRSAPVIIGGATGAAVGFFDPDRLERTAIYGSAGTLGGIGLGLLVGPAIWPEPEGKWAGAAIGAGVGLVIGSNYGLFFAKGKSGKPDAESKTLSVPIVFTYRF